MLVTLLVIVLSGGPTTTSSMWIYSFILIPIEASLLALLAIVLIYAFARLFQRNVTVPVIIFAG
jgi:hypothetical protein